MSHPTRNGGIAIVVRSFPIVGVFVTVFDISVSILSFFLIKEKKWKIYRRSNQMGGKSSRRPPTGKITHEARASQKSGHRLGAALVVCSPRGGRNATLHDLRARTLLISQHPPTKLGEILSQEATIWHLVGDLG